MADNKTGSLLGKGMSNDNSLNRRLRRLQDPLVGDVGNKKVDALPNPGNRIKSVFRRKSPGKRSKKIVEFILNNYGKEVTQDSIAQLEDKFDLYYMLKCLLKLNNAGWSSNGNNIVNEDISINLPNGCSIDDGSIRFNGQFIDLDTNWINNTLELIRKTNNGTDDIIDYINSLRSNNV